MPFQKGNKLRLGFRHSDETKRKISESKKGTVCSVSHRMKLSYAGMGRRGWSKGLRTSNVSYNAFKKGHIPWSKGKTVPSMRGKNHPNWIGGATGLDRSVRNSVQYAAWRTACFEAFQYTCQECSEIGYELVVHHKIPLAVILENNNIQLLDEALDCEPLWDIENGLVLCKACHIALHKIIGKAKRKNPLAKMFNKVPEQLILEGV